jgi:hypothetical protein
VSWIRIRIQKWYGSADPDLDPDPYKNVTDLQHWESHFIPSKKYIQKHMAHNALLLEPVYRVHSAIQSVEGDSWLQLMVKV